MCKERFNAIRHNVPKPPAGSNIGLRPVGAAGETVEVRERMGLIRHGVARILLLLLLRSCLLTFRISYFVFRG